MNGIEKNEENECLCVASEFWFIYITDLKSYIFGMLNFIMILFCFSLFKTNDWHALIWFQIVWFLFKIEIANAVFLFVFLLFFFRYNNFYFEIMQLIVQISKSWRTLFVTVRVFCVDLLFYNDTITLLLKLIKCW